MVNRKITTEVKTISSKDSNKLLKSVNCLFEMKRSQTYLPVMNKYVDLNNDNKCLTNFVLKSKYKCISIDAIIEDDYSDSELSLELKTDLDTDVEKNLQPNNNKCLDIEENINLDEINIEKTSEKINNVEGLDESLKGLDESLEGLDESLEELSESSEEQDISNCLSVICNIEKTNGRMYKEKAFIKISPIIEPLKRLMDKFQDNTENLGLLLPNHLNYNTVNKLNSYHNAAYIETYCLYLLNKLTENGMSPGFPYYYGSINGIKKEYFHDITDEYPDLKNKKWFRKQEGETFELITISESGSCSSSYQSNLNLSKKSGKSNISSESSNIDIDISNLSLTSNKSLENDLVVKESCDELADKKESNVVDNVVDNVINLSEISKKELDQLDITKNDGSNYTIKLLDNLSDIECLSDIDYKSIKSDSDKSNSELSISSSKFLSSDTEFEVESIADSASDFDINELENNKMYFLRLQDYPVQLSIMEHMNTTLDQLLDKGYQMSEREWVSVLYQIVFSLAVAQKHINFCHNDLHSSNIMFKPTKEKYLYYHINNTFYKIPTFGKIVKIIDFARATFKHDGTVYFSDVFAKDGEAEGQYDFPCKSNNFRYNTNPSFDLVRLATTIKERLDNKPAIRNLINKWMMTDYGSNIGYQTDDFQLYVSISNDCHNAIPVEVIKSKIFKQFEISKNNKPNNKYVYYY